MSDILKRKEIKLKYY